jgi:spore maturation protein SpmA
MTKTVLSQETVTAYAIRTVTAAPATITATVTSRETTTIYETKTITMKEKRGAPILDIVLTTLLLVVALAVTFVVYSNIMKRHKIKRLPNYR